MLVSQTRGGVFTPDEIAVMTAAYELACSELKIRDRTNALCELLAKKIIEIAKRGERDPQRMCRDAVAELLGVRPA
jgi:hypothetical protein